MVKRKLAVNEASNAASGNGISSSETEPHIASTIPKRSKQETPDGSSEKEPKKCGKCQKLFRTEQGLKKHVESVHTGIRYRCPICSDMKRQMHTLKDHIGKKHATESEIKCIYCQCTFTSCAELCMQEHINKCSCVKPEQQEAAATEGSNTDNSEPELPPKIIRIPEDPQEPTEDIVEAIPEHLRELFLEYWRIIRTNRNTEDILDHEYNFRWSEGGVKDMVSDIFENENSTFRINAALGAILMHTETYEMIYFYASDNNFSLLDRPKLIATDEDRQQLVDKLEDIETQDAVTRPDTKWVLLAITNITFFVTVNPNFIAGCKLDSLPDYITRQRNNILTVQYTESNNRINDNLCFFRTLAHCLTGTYYDKKYVMALFKKYCEKKKIVPSKVDFHGVPFTDIPLLEKLFSVNIQLFHLTEAGVAMCWRHVVCTYEKTLNLLVHITEKSKVHYCYIRNLDAFSKRYVCIECGRLFRKIDKLNRHVKLHRCKQGKTEHCFPGGVYKNSQTLFEELESVDIVVAQQLKRCNFLTVFDFETLLKKVNRNLEVDATEQKEEEENQNSEQDEEEEEEEDSEAQEEQAADIEDIPQHQQQLQKQAKTTYYNYHQPVSCAIQTNVDGFLETFYCVSDDPEVLTKQFVDYLEKVSDGQYTILAARYSALFSQLDDKIKDTHERIALLKQQKIDVRREKGFVNYLKQLQKKLDRYCQQLTVIGFNSKKYDLNLIKRQLYPKLIQNVRKSRNKSEEEDVLLDTEDYTDDHLDDSAEAEMGGRGFLDAEAAEDSDHEDNTPHNEVDNNDDDDDDVNEHTGKREKKFLLNKRLEWPKAIVHNNACMCLTTPKLRFLDMTNYLAAGSSLESFLNMYETDLRKAKFPYTYLDNFDKLAEKSLPPKEAFFNDLRQEPISEADYEQCQQYWREYNMSTFGDYLMFYNKRDVEPFLQATRIMGEEFWKKFQIDIFRDVISLPGLTLRYLFNKTDTTFGLFSRRDKQIYYKLKQSMLGGLSLVMTRLAVAEETLIRSNLEKLVAIIIGFDANALYLWAQANDMPTGFYDLWLLSRTGQCFEKRSCSKRIATEWLEMESWTTHRTIEHQGNGKEKRVGTWRLPVDGWCKEEKLVYEFYGCYWHCHNCPSGIKNTRKDRKKAADWIKTKEDYITNTLNYKLITIWECDWRAERQNYYWTRECYDPGFFRKYQNVSSVSEQAMRKSILDGSVFGFAEVDVHTPDHLKSLYADFPPIIKKAEITREHIGDHMRDYADKTGQFRQPRTNLISTYSAKNIVLMTPMIQFLVKHGVRLDKVHMVIQYDRTRPFEWFCDLVTENRLSGDGYNVDKDEHGQPVATMSATGKTKASTLAADTFKLLGNTGYGKSITNKEKHTDTFYCDYEKAVECNLSPYVKRIKHVTANCYEVQMYKRKIQMNLPIVIGLATYSWAKIKMLSFAYDFLLKFLDKADYQWMETDTDSAYLALSNNDIRQIVKPEMRDQFEREYKDWFVDPDVPYTTRKPGLFKEEFRGTAMACLCSKTYIAVDELSGKTKMSSKGLSHRLNKKAFEDYRRVLQNQRSEGGQNRGFVLRNDNQLWTYLQERLGLSYLYIKRVVGDDGISTKPLDI